MRTLFTIYSVTGNALSFENWMTETGIKYVRRSVRTAFTVRTHWVVDTEDYNSILTVEHWVDTEAVRWEITACNKQYVTECIGDDNRRYLGSMCQVGPINAYDHNKEHASHWSLYALAEDSHWIACLRNPDVIKPFTSLGVETGRWPVDPKCPPSAYENHRSQRADVNRDFTE